MKNGVNCKGLEKSVSYALLLLTVSFAQPEGLGQDALPVEVILIVGSS